MMKSIPDNSPEESEQEKPKMKKNKKMNIEGFIPLSKREKKKKLGIASLVTGIKKMHEIFSAFGVYDPMLTRPIRFVFIYVKFMLVLMIIIVVC